MSLTTQQYRDRDIPIKCLKCRQWMRHNPRKPSKRCYVTRGQRPKAHLCITCETRS